MATQTRAASKPSANGTPKLPPITVAKFEEALRLVEAIVEEKTSIFVEKANAYREVHREGTSRPLNAQEAAQITAAMADQLGNVAENPGGTIARIQDSELRAYDEPDQQEVLLAAGISTAPEFVDAGKRLVALVEMGDSEFRAAHEADTVDDALDEAVKGMAYLNLQTEARPRAIAAMAHFSQAAGAGGPGEAWALISRAVLQALNQAMSASPRSSVTSSLIDTDGDEQTSSTDSPTETPSST